MNRVYWVRHGENRANLTKEFSYMRVDYPLTPKGILQSEQTADYFATQEIHAVFSSPLKRARETASIVAARLGLPVTVIEELREINVGDLENGPPCEASWKAHDRILEAWMRGQWELAFPGGENGHELIERIQTGLGRVLAGRSDRNLMVVSHSGCLMMGIPSLVPGADLAGLRERGLGNCAISDFQLEQRGQQVTGRIVRWGVVSHLSGPAARLIGPLPVEGEQPASSLQYQQLCVRNGGSSQ
jgi:2,3-bisphosphoglycerate-dependent phosphoglycerate mutase